jgi:predicted metal-dependent enzyme (double-stranded beta helix superfamily)
MLNLSAFKEFQDSHYTRHLVLQSERLEILVVCWRPGQCSPVHGHGPSDGIMIMLEGSLVNTTFPPNGERTITTVWQPGDVGHTPVGYQHEVKNTSDKDVMSLHIYAPPLNRELQGADMGYHNTVTPHEITLPNEVVRYLLGAALPKIPPELLDVGL